MSLIYPTYILCMLICLVGFIMLGTAQARERHKERESARASEGRRERQLRQSEREIERKGEIERRERYLEGERERERFRNKRVALLRTSSYKR